MMALFSLMIPIQGLADPDKPPTCPARATGFGSARISNTRLRRQEYSEQREPTKRHLHCTASALVL